ncbi:MAG: carboxypeptidase-like regulatory domain-containing protein, partial [Gaiellaceae bacterium]
MTTPGVWGKRLLRRRRRWSLTLAGALALMALTGAFPGGAGAAVFTVSGHIASGVSDLPGVSVSLTDTTTPGTVTSTTDSFGNYSFSGVNGGDDYTITPSLTNYTFSPSSISITFLAADSPGNDFSASLNTYSISGNVSGASGVSVALSGSASSSTVTDGSGNYSFTGLNAGGNYTVTPSKTNY